MDSSFITFNLEESNSFPTIFYANISSVAFLNMMSKDLSARNRVSVISTQLGLRDLQLSCSKQMFNLYLE
jgi:hypothetical protein